MGDKHSKETAFISTKPSAISEGNLKATAALRCIWDPFWKAAAWAASANAKLDNNPMRERGPRELRRGSAPSVWAKHKVTDYGDKEAGTPQLQNPSSFQHRGQLPKRARELLGRGIDGRIPPGAGGRVFPLQVEPTASASQQGVPASPRP